MSASKLADFMVASEQSRRTLIRGCKYRPISRVIQHSRAKNIVGEYLRSGKDNPVDLIEKAQNLRDMMADDDFDRDLLDNNADYIENFSKVAGNLVLPLVEIRAC